MTDRREPATARLRELAGKATPQPWTLVTYRHGVGRLHQGGTLIADIYQPADCDYLTALVVEAPALLARIEALEAALAAAREYRDKFQSIDSVPIRLDLSEAIDVERDGLFRALRALDEPPQ